MGLSSCQAAAESSTAQAPHKKAWTAPVFPLKVSISPPNAMRAVEPARRVVVTASGGRLTGVRVVSSKGKAVAGALSPDGTLWTAASGLAFGTEYAVVADAVGNDTKAQRVQSSFITADPSKLAYPSMSPIAGETVGVGMPILVTFDRPVVNKAAAERRMTVRTSRPVQGTWHWLSDYNVHYRPRVYWPAHTAVTVDLNLLGVDLGDGVYGQANRHVPFTVGSAVISTISNATKSMTVVQDGKVLRTMPVSLGKPSMPTSAGTHVVMEKFSEKYFDSASFGLPRDAPGGYYTKVYWDTRFTGGGEFVHAAPWSTGSQGRRNVSHGCVNVSTSNARWFYYLSKRGDVVRVIGTERQVRPGDGYTDWNLTWEQYLQGSALI
ncbi:MAG: Ig-like domain-containing protein [Mycobacteriales bacterium]